MTATGHEFGVAVDAVRTAKLNQFRNRILRVRRFDFILALVAIQVGFGMLELQHNADSSNGMEKAHVAVHKQERSNPHNPATCARSFSPRYAFAPVLKSAALTSPMPTP